MLKNSGGELPAFPASAAVVAENVAGTIFLVYSRRHHVREFLQNLVEQAGH
jgi:hypothetical protein